MGTTWGENIELWDEIISDFFCVYSFSCDINNKTKSIGLILQLDKFGCIFERNNNDTKSSAIFLISEPNIQGYYHQKLF